MNHRWKILSVGDRAGVIANGKLMVHERMSGGEQVSGELLQRQ